MPERWDIEGIGRALGAKARAIDDPTAGEGYQIDLPYAQATLELFPQTLVVRYRNPQTYLEMQETSLEYNDGVKLVCKISIHIKAIFQYFSLRALQTTL